MKTLALLLISTAVFADITTYNIKPSQAVHIGGAGDVVAVQRAFNGKVYITHGQCTTDINKAIMIRTDKIVSLGTLTAEVCAFTVGSHNKIKVQKD